MKFSLNWIREFVDINVPVDELAERLTLSGLEVEGVETLGASLSGIVVGRIESIEKHPDADKLVVCQVTDGKTRHQIVTGAQNIKEGDVVPVSLPGAVLANGMEIKASELRGVPSNGMLCSETELGVSDEAAGIWILPQDTPLGVDFVEYARLRDAVLDIGILPNRGDCQSVLGIARDISAIYELDLKEVEILDSRSGSGMTAGGSGMTASEKSITCRNEAPDLCAMYTARTISNVWQFATPLWMQRRLQVSGVRPISFIVDVTNYVLLELGQPLHAFDASKVKGAIVVRSAEDGEALVTLDEQERKLVAGQCVIADDAGAVALAGVMGGARTEINDHTTDVVLEAAWFDPVATRATATAHVLRTDSAVRFEKGLDIAGVERASNRVAHLIKSLAGAEVGDICQASGHTKDSDASSFDGKIDVDLNALNRLIGVQYTADQAWGTLRRLGYGVAVGVDSRSGSGMTAGSGITVVGSVTAAGSEIVDHSSEMFACVTVPTWRRHDVLGWQEVAEDIMRVVGMDSIASCLPRESVVQVSKSDDERVLSQLHSFFIANGFSQVINFSMVGQEDAVKCDWKTTDSRTISNPLTPAESVMRERILPSLLRVVGHDASRQVNRGAIFEFGSVFPSDGVQDTHLAGVVYGDWFESSYRPEDKLAGADVLRLKGIVCAALEALGVIQIRVDKRCDDGDLHPGQAGTIASLKHALGRFGKVHPARLKAYGISVPVSYFEINVSSVLKSVRPQPKYKAFGVLPHTRRDIAIVVPKDLAYSSIESVLYKKKPKLCKRLFLFDRFESVEHLGADKLSLAFAFVYQDDETTLTDEVVNLAHTEFVAAITAALPIEIR